MLCKNFVVKLDSRKFIKMINPAVDVDSQCRIYPFEF